MKIKKTITIILALFVAGIIVPVAPRAVVQAQTSTLQSQLDMIAQLTKQIQDLQNQILALQQKAQEINVQRQTQVAELVKNLSQGSSGSDVKVLQALLAADPIIYPEGLITGYYGFLTSKAVRKFQEKHDIEQVGVVGPKTLKKLNEFLRENPIGFQVSASSTTTSTISWNRGHERDDEHEVCAIVPPGHQIARGWLKEHERQVVPTCQTLPPGIDKKEHGDDNENENEDENDNEHNVPSAPDVAAPVISAISATNIMANSANINWLTSENSDSKVYYSVTTPVNTSSAQAVYGINLVTSHLLGLTGLNASTTYYYLVASKDASGNTAISSENSFTTSQPADVTAPVISSVSAINVASTTATITWTTNENSTSKVYYSTTTPLNFSTALTATVSGLTASHSVGLIGLNATTTYFYAVESADAVSNTATSSQSSFTTTL